MTSDLSLAVVELYDHFVLANADAGGVKVAEAKTGIRDAVRQLVAGAERDIDRETDALIAAAVNPERARRSRSLRTQLGYFLDGFIEDGPYVDPMLDMAFGLGDEHGVDKALRHWTIEDFSNLTVTRYRVAADSTAAAKELDETCQQVIGRMHITGAATFGDVVWSVERQAS